MDIHIGIEPKGTLAETSRIIGEILGIKFLEDNTGAYDEYPSYLAEMGGVNYALLGIPNPEEDVRDCPTNDFELIVESTSSSPTEDLMKDIIRRLSTNGHVRCWSLE